MTSNKIYDKVDLDESMIADVQHVVGNDFTKIRCGQKFINDQCLCLPQANWQTWRAHTVRGKDRGYKCWHIVLVFDDDGVILSFLKAARSGNIDVKDYGEILKSGWGKDPPEEAREAARQKYDIYKKIDKTVNNSGN